MALYKRFWNRKGEAVDSFKEASKETMSPVLGIEIDDSSHERQSRKDRDQCVDDVFTKAGLKILHIKAARGYVPEVIARKFSQAL